MRLGNIGNKDECGEQGRSEHRSKYLRIGRTGATGNCMGAMNAMLGSRPMLNVDEIYETVLINLVKRNRSTVWIGIHLVDSLNRRFFIPKQ